MLNTFDALSVIILSMMINITKRTAELTAGENAVSLFGHRQCLSSILIYIIFLDLYENAVLLSLVIC